MHHGLCNLELSVVLWSVRLAVALVPFGVVLCGQLLCSSFASVLNSVFASDVSMGRVAGTVFVGMCLIRAALQLCSSPLLSRRAVVVVAAVVLVFGGLYSCPGHGGGPRWSRWPGSSQGAMSCEWPPSCCPVGCSDRGMLLCGRWTPRLSVSERCLVCGRLPLCRPVRFRSVRVPAPNPAGPRFAGPFTTS